MVRAWVVAMAAGMAAVGIAQENLLENPGLEELEDGRAVGWQIRTDGSVEFLRDGGHEGDGYARLIDESDTTGYFLESMPIPSRPEGAYTATAWFRPGENCSPGVYLNFYDDVGIRVHNLYTRTEKGPTEAWVQATVTAEAPVEALTVTVGLYSYAADVGESDVDDVTLTVEGGKEPGSGTIPRAEPGEKTMVDIGSRLEMFVDEFMVDSLTGEAERRLHQPIPRNVVVTFDKPWEGPFCGYVSVVNDGDLVRIYYRGWSDLEGPDCCCVIESTDGGVTFTRPNVGIFEWEGSKENNIIWMGAGCHNFTPVLDTNPNAPADQCYKALASAGPNASLVPFASPDGLTWRRLQEEPVITEGAFDSQNLAFWDDLQGQYVEYHRGFKDGVRDIMTSTSADFINWTDPVWLSYGDAPKEHLYTNAIFPYPRAPHLYIGLPCRFVPGRKKVESHKESGINDGVLMSSRDGLNFERWVEAFIRPGPDALRWTDRNNYPAWGLAQTSEEELSVYWTEHYRYPDYRMRRGSIRTDGFVSLHANATGGEALTRPFTYTGGRLVVNYATSAIGTLMFELCDEAGAAHDGFALGLCEPLFGDELQAEVKWRSGAEPAALAGQAVRLRVRLKDADLYSFRLLE